MHPCFSFRWEACSSLSKTSRRSPSNSKHSSLFSSSHRTWRNRPLQTFKLLFCHRRKSCSLLSRRRLAHIQQNAGIFEIFLLLTICTIPLFCTKGEHCINDSSERSASEWPIVCNQCRVFISQSACSSSTSGAHTLWDWTDGQSTTICYC